jgi:hypothetical protein
MQTRPAEKVSSSPREVRRTLLAKHEPPPFNPVFFCFRLSQLMSRFDEIRASGELMPSALMAMASGASEGRNLCYCLIYPRDTCSCSTHFEGSCPAPVGRRASAFRVGARLSLLAARNAQTEWLPRPTDRYPPPRLRPQMICCGLCNSQRGVDRMFTPESAICSVCTASSVGIGRAREAAANSCRLRPVCLTRPSKGHENGPRSACSVPLLGPAPPWRTVADM